MADDYLQSAVADLGRAQVNIAKLEVQVDHLTKAVADLKDGNTALSAQLTEIHDLMSEARGGWRVLMLVGGCAATVGGAVSWLAQHIRVSP